MAKLINSLTQLIGNAPLLGLGRLSAGAPTEVLVKLAARGSAKDHVGFSMIKDAKKKGLITDSTVIIEPSNGRSSTTLPFMAAACGCRLILTMPDTISLEQRNLWQASGAEVILTSGDEGMKGAVRKVKEIAIKFPNTFLPQQLKNGHHPSHYRGTTVEEIWADTKGEVDILIGGVGSSGIIIDVGEIIKRWKPALQVIIVGPLLLADRKSGLHKVYGNSAGGGFGVPNLDVVDEVSTVRTEEAFEIVKRLAKEEGLLVGLSSGAAIFTALQIAGRFENQGKRVVALLPDNGQRYLSKPLFQD